MCVVEMKRRTFGSISHFLKPIEEPGTESRTETILPPATLVPLLPLFSSNLFPLPVLLSASISLLHSPPREYIAAQDSSLETLYTAPQRVAFWKEINDKRIRLLPLEWIHPGFLESYTWHSTLMRGQEKVDEGGGKVPWHRGRRRR